MKINVVQSLSVVFLVVALASCSKTPKELPYLGNKEAVKKMVDGGKEVVDTLYHTIPDFEFINQDSVKITQEFVAGKIYIADFFFTTCPTICPKMKTQMLRIYEKYKDNPNVVLLSHSIDPRHDTPAVLKEFRSNLGIKGNSWQMVTGDKAKIYEIGQKSYMVSAADDPTQPGGVVHSGAFILVDKNRHIRGLYDGTVAAKVDNLMDDMEILLKETSSNK
ncbi:SCO family protein [Arcicella aquatica]|uniref:SCO family protein n=1 Tax=Arcicella aquatica TaxID=217141 RepID=A0ABU5QMN3_9BACT|nr:SCO family protein [Arcicella aquatica]MEA5258070.1 SCO family protein [Arcicella aquatica]